MVKDNSILKRTPFRIRKALSVFLALFFLCPSSFPEIDSLAPLSRINNVSFENSLTAAVICKYIERDGNMGGDSGLGDVMNRLSGHALDAAGVQSPAEHITAISLLRNVKVLPDEVTIEIPHENLAVRYFNPGKANVVTPYSDVIRLSTTVISPGLHRQIIHRLPVLEAAAPARQYPEALPENDLSAEKMGTPAATANLRTGNIGLPNWAPEGRNTSYDLDTFIFRTFAPDFFNEPETLSAIAGRMGLGSERAWVLNINVTGQPVCGHNRTTFKVTVTAASGSVLKTSDFAFKMATPYHYYNKAVVDDGPHMKKELEFSRLLGGVPFFRSHYSSTLALKSYSIGAAGDEILERFRLGYTSVSAIYLQLDEWACGTTMKNYFKLLSECNLPREKRTELVRNAALQTVTTIVKGWHLLKTENGGLIYDTGLDDVIMAYPEGLTDPEEIGKAGSIVFIDPNGGRESGAEWALLHAINTFLVGAEHSGGKLGQREILSVIYDVLGPQEGRIFLNKVAGIDQLRYGPARESTLFQSSLKEGGDAFLKGRASYLAKHESATKEQMVDPELGAWRAEPEYREAIQCLRIAFGREFMERNMPEIDRLVCGLIEGSGDASVPALITAIFDYDYLSRVESSEGDIVAHLRLYNVILREEQKAYRVIWHIINEGFMRDGIINIRLEETEFERVRAFVRRFGGFYPLLFSLFRENAVKVSSIADRFSAAVPYDVIGIEGMGEICSDIAGFEAMKYGEDPDFLYKVMGELMRAVSNYDDTTMPYEPDTELYRSPFPKFTHFHRMIRAAQESVSADGTDAEDPRNHVPEKLRGRDFGNGTVLHVSGWNLKKGEKLSSEMRQFVYGLRPDREAAGYEERFKIRQRLKSEIAAVLNKNILRLDDESVRDELLRLSIRFIRLDDPLRQTLWDIQDCSYESLCLIEEQIMNGEGFLVPISQARHKITTECRQLYPKTIVNGTEDLDKELVGKKVFGGVLDTIAAEKKKFERTGPVRKMELEFRAVKGIPHSVWGYIVDTCMKDDKGLWQSKDLFLMEMFDAVSKKIVGYAGLSEADINGEKVLVVAGIQPTVGLLAEAGLNTVMPLIDGALLNMRDEGGYRHVYLAGPESDRVGILDIAEERYGPQFKIPEIRWASEGFPSTEWVREIQPGRHGVTEALGMFISDMRRRDGVICRFDNSPALPASGRPGDSADASRKQYWVRHSRAFSRTVDTLIGSIPVRVTWNAADMKKLTETLISQGSQIIQVKKLLGVSLEHLCDELLDNAYDAVVSSYDPELLPDGPGEGYAGVISVSFGAENGYFTVNVTDNGPGKNAAGTGRKIDKGVYGGKKGRGLQNIRAIMQALGGELELCLGDAGHRGSTATIKIPLEKLTLKAGASFAAAPQAGRAYAQKFINYLTVNSGAISDALMTGPGVKLLRIPVEAIESVGFGNIQSFIEAFQAAGGYAELYYMSGTGDIGDAVYRKYGLTRKKLPEKFRSSRENTVTLFAAFKGEEIDRTAVIKRLGSAEVTTRNTILSPIGLQHDAAGLIRAAILGLQTMEVARQIKKKGELLARNQAFRDSIQLTILENLKNVCGNERLRDFDLTPDDIIGLASGNINDIVTALNKLIKLLPIIPINAEELRQIYEHAKEVVTAA